MKTILILRKLITIYYYLLCIGFIGLLVAPFAIFSDNPFSVKYNGFDIDISNYSLINKLVILLLVWAVYVLFFRAIQLLKYTLNDLSEGNYFSKTVISNFKNAGKFLLYCAVSTLTASTCLMFLLDLPIKIGVHSDFLLFIIMGLFFMFLSEVFSKAKKIQEENDLTV